jgi:hypothetical protein
MNVQFDMIFELHGCFIVHTRPKNPNLLSWKVLDTILTAATIASNSID